MAMEKLNNSNATSYYLCKLIESVFHISTIEQLLCGKSVANVVGNHSRLKISFKWRESRHFTLLFRYFAFKLNLYISLHRVSKWNERKFMNNCGFWFSNENNKFSTFKNLCSLRTHSLDRIEFSFGQTFGQLMKITTKHSWQCWPTANDSFQRKKYTLKVSAADQSLAKRHNYSGKKVHWMHLLVCLIFILFNCWKFTNWVFAWKRL